MMTYILVETGNKERKGLLLEFFKKFEFTYEILKKVKCTNRKCKTQLRPHIDTTNKLCAECGLKILEEI